MDEVLKFQFTPVLRRATQMWNLALTTMTFQFTPVLRRATATICSIIAIIKYLSAS